MRQEKQYPGRVARYTVRHQAELEHPYAIYVYDFD